MVGTGMRKEKQQNVEIVYSAMKSLYEKTKDWKKPLSFKDIENIVNSTLEEKTPLLSRNKKPEYKEGMNRRAIYRHLKTLLKEKPPRVFKVGDRGLYTIDYAIEQNEKERKEITRSIMSIKGCSKREGVYDSSENSLVLEYVKKWRLRTHGQKDVAQIEADIWVNSLLDALSLDIGTGEAPLIIKPGSGLDTFVSRKAIEIVFALLESLDLKYLEQDKTNSTLSDSQLAITIKFNPAKFLNKMRFYRDFWELKLNSDRMPKFTTEAGLVCRRFDERYLKKRIFKEIFKNQPNERFTGK
jgi:hypothetical protein